MTIFSRVLAEKLIDVQLVTEFPNLHQPDVLLTSEQIIYTKNSALL
jgi:hypothetical protein